MEENCSKTGQNLRPSSLKQTFTSIKRACLGDISVCALIFLVIVCIHCTVMISGNIFTHALEVTGNLNQTFIPTASANLTC